MFFLCQAALGMYQLSVPFHMKLGGGACTEPIAIARGVGKMALLTRNSKILSYVVVGMCPQHVSSH